jgi:hypothetical protein
MLQLRALFLSLLVVSPLAVAAATVTERPISEARTGVASGSAWRSMQAAWNGEHFLVTWYSLRRGGQALVVDAAGKPLFETATALPIYGEAVFWRDDAWYIIGHGQGVFGWVRVSADGVLLDLEPHPIARGPGTFEGAVWTGQSLIAIWVTVEASTQTGSTTAWVYDADFQPKATHAVGNWTWVISLLTDGTTALLAFRENRDSDYTTHAVLFGLDGQLLRQRTLDRVPMAYAGGTRGGGTGYFFVSAAPEGELASLGSFHLDHNLDLKRGLGTFGPLEGPYWFTAGDLAWDGSAYTFFYRSFITGLRMSRVEPDGQLVEDVTLLPLSGSEWTSGLATAGGLGTTLLLYPESDLSFTSSDTHVLRLRSGHDAASLAAAAGLRLEYGAFEQTAPVAASGDTQSLVAWRERVSVTEPPRIYATRVLNGEVLDPQSLLLGTLTIDFPEVQLATDGEAFVAAWTDPEGIITRRVGADGTVGPKVVIPREDREATANSLELLSNGDGYLVVWVEHHTAFDRAFAVRLRGDGAVLDTKPIDLGQVQGGLIGTTDGSGYLLAGRGTNGALISNTGAVTARPNFGGNVIQTVWWNGTSYAALVYPIDFNDHNGYRVAQVAADGSVTFGSSLAPPPPSVAWALGHFDACRALGCSRLRGNVEDGEYVLREERVGAAGFAYGSATTVMPARRLDQYDLMRGALLRVPGGRLWAAVERRAPGSPYAGISRIFITALDPSRVRSVRH